MVQKSLIRRRPVAVAPLLLDTAEERQLFKKGEANYQAKKALRTKNLLKRAPDNEESDLIHSLWTTEMSYLSMYSPTLDFPDIC